MKCTDPCSFPECKNTAQYGLASGLCTSHKTQFYRNGKCVPIKRYQAKRSKAKEVCDFPDCTGKMGIYTDLCPAHYGQRRRGQELKAIRPYSLGMSSLEDLMKETTEVDGCLRFRKAATYSKVNYKGKTWVTHRLSYHLATGDDVDGIAIHHKCANTWCMKPDHLELATDYDNNLEMLARKSYEAKIAQLEAKVIELETELAKVMVIR